MASLMEDLINVLNQEEEQYQGLIELGKIIGKVQHIINVKVRMNFG